MPTGGAEGRVYGVYGEAATQTDDPRIAVYSAYAEAATRRPDPKIEVYSTYVEVLSVVPKGKAGFVGWGIPM